MHKDSKDMKLPVRLFALARDLAGAERITVELPDAATVADLRAALGEQAPALRPLVASLHVALGTNYATDDQTLTSDAEVACFPPVSGG